MNFFFLCLFVFLHEISVFKTSFQEVQVNKSNSGHIQIPTHSVESRKNHSHLKNISWNQFTAHTYSRNFDKEILRVNCRNFHTVLHDTIRYQIFASLVQIAYIAPLYDIIHWIPFLRLFYAFFFFFEESLNLREPVQWNITLFSNNTLDTLACSKMVFTYFQIAMLF